MRMGSKRIHYADDLFGFESMTFNRKGLSEVTDEEEKEFQKVFDFLKDSENWKLPTKEMIFSYAQRILAGVVADVLIFYTGGAEIVFRNDGIHVKSRGYYHYIGA